MEPIKTALCSFGMSGWVFHAPFINLHPGFELYGVLERSKNLAREKYPGIKTFRSLDELLQDDAVALLIVNTPNYTHYEYAKAGLEAGKHVVVEKPFTLHVTEAETLIELAEKKNKKLSVYQNRRWDSDFKTVQDVVNKKFLGRIVEAEIHFDRFKEGVGPKLHKEIPGPGTGILYDLGSHLIDQAIRLFGMPQSIFADTGIIRPVSKVDDYMELLLFCNTVRVRLKASYVVRELLPSYILHGAKGSFVKPRADVQETDLQAGKSPGVADWGEEPESGNGLLHTEIGGKVIREYLPSLRGNYMEYYEGLYQALRNNAPLPVTAREGMEVIRVIEAAFKSVSEKRTIDL
jgi:predicted dehydrogenase